MQELFFKRVDGIEDIQWLLHTIISENKDKPDIQLKATNQLHELSPSLINLYDALPMMSGLGVDAFRHVY